MPTVSKKQERFMQAVAHNPAFAKKAGVPQSVGKEFTKSETAIRKRIDNTPNAAHAQNLKNVCEKILEPVRNHFGKPVRINSGYRGPALNSAVGGSSKSQHCNGEAVDFEIDGLPNPDLASLS